MGLERARSRHPMLLSRIVLKKGNKVVFEPDETLAPVQLKEVDGKKWKVTLANEMDILFTANDCPLFRAIFSNFEGSSRFAIILHHSIADAAAGISLMEEVLSFALGKEKDERPVKEPLPEMEKLFPGHVKGISKIFKVAKFGLSLAADKLGDAPLKLPFFEDISFEARYLDILPVSIDSSLSDGILTRSKDEGATVHGALSAGLITALRGFYPSRHNASFSVISPVGLRNRLNIKLSPDEMGNYIGHLITVKGPDEDFWSLAREVSREMRERIDKGEAHSVCSSAPSPRFYHPTEKGVAKFNRLMFIHPHSQMISNVGKVDDIWQKEIAEVESVYSLISPHTRDGVSLCVSTYRGKLTINLVYSTLALPPEIPGKLITRFERALNRACS